MKTEWVNVKERLPTMMKHVLVRRIKSKPCVAYWYKDDWAVSRKSEYFDLHVRWQVAICKCKEFTENYDRTYILDINKVTHWMPLPEPPK